MLVATRGQEQEPVPLLVRYPFPDRERLAGIRQELQRAEIGGEHGPHAERGLRVLRIHDGLRHRALHGLGERRQVGLQQMIDQDPVLGDPLPAQHAGTVGEELAGGGDPERVHRVLLLGDERGGHHVEVAGIARFEERRPARRAGIQRVHQHVAVRIEEGPGVGAHLVVDHAALAPGPDLRHQIGDQHRLAGPGGARDDGVLGLRALGIGNAGDAVGPEPGAARQARQQDSDAAPAPGGATRRR